MAAILIVDDHPDACRVLARLFAKTGHAADVALSGEEAIEKLDAAPALPDVVLLDVMMPGMDGLEVLRRLRESPRTAAMPVVMYSALGDSALAAHAMGKGANGYIVKGRLGFEELRVELGPYLRAAG